MGRKDYVNKRAFSFFLFFALVLDYQAGDNPVCKKMMGFDRWEKKRSEDDDGRSKMIMGMMKRKRRKEGGKD